MGWGLFGRSGEGFLIRSKRKRYLPKILTLFRKDRHTFRQTGIVVHSEVPLQKINITTYT